MTLANAARRLNSSPRRTRLPAGLWFSDEVRTPDAAECAKRLPPAIGLVLRHYGLPQRRLIAAQTAKVGKTRRQILLVAGDWRLAAAIGAAGIHLPEGLARSGRLAEALGWARRRGTLVTMACHSPRALDMARQLRVDAALLSPVFATASHPGQRGIGAVRFRIWARRAHVPVYALGGITAARLRQLPGLDGFAAIGGW